MAERYDDAVVGAGIVGMAHAYHLARRGRRVIVFERNRKAEGASIRNFGMIWPIGQPLGWVYQLALKSRGYWLTVLRESGLWHQTCGSIHLAYHEDEAQVIREFVEIAPKHGVECEYVDGKSLLDCADAIKPDGLIGGMWSPTELCVDPRDVVANLPAWLTKTYGVRFEFTTLVAGYDRPTVTTHHVSGKSSVEADRLWVCSGDDLLTLYPECFENSDLLRTKLHMMRSQPYGDDFKIGAHLAAGLTLQHYKSFAECPTLPELKERLAREMPLYNEYGIHVMASQNGRGEIAIGDSHEYNADVEIFNKSEIDTLILDYLNTFLNAPGLHIASRWHGIYMKHPTEPYFRADPADGATVVTGAGSTGMTLSFGIADRVVNDVLGDST